MDLIIRPFCFLLIYIAVAGDAVLDGETKQKHPPPSLINRFYSNSNNYNHNPLQQHQTITNTSNSNNQTLKLRRLNYDHSYSMNATYQHDELSKSYHRRSSNENLTFFSIPRKNYFYSNGNVNVRSLMKPTVPATNDYYNDVELLDLSTNNWMNRNTNEHGATPTSSTPTTTTTTPGPLTLKHNSKNLQRFVLFFVFCALRGNLGVLNYTLFLGKTGFYSHFLFKKAHWLDVMWYSVIGCFSVVWWFR